MLMQNKLAAFLALLGLAGAVAGLGMRFEVEQRNRDVEISLDYREIEQLVGATGESFQAVLGRFKKAGVTSVAIQEDTVADLLDNGRLTLMAQKHAALGPVTTAYAADAALRQRLQERVRVGFGSAGKGQEFGVYLLGDGVAYRIPAAVQQLRLLPMGLDPEAVRNVRAAGLGVVARLCNYPGANPQYLDYEMAEMRRDGVKTVIFAADQVLGFRGLKKLTAETMRKHGISYGSVEFAKQKGDAGLSRAMDARVIRVHSITLPEMGLVDRGTAIERYARAARERNVRLCYVRLFDFAAEDPVGANVAYVRDVARAIAATGARMGTAPLLEEPGVPSWLFGLMAVGAAGLFSLLLGGWFEMRTITQAATAIAGAATAFALAFAGGEMGRKLVALGVALIAPLLALTWAVSGRKPMTERFNASVAGKAALLFVGTVAITAAGGVVIAGLLSSRLFMLRIDQFAGVKLAHVLPILAAALLFSAETIWDRCAWQEQKRRAAEGIRRLAANPVLVWQAAISLAILISVAIVVARSGNDAGVGVSDLELKIRALMDRLLYVRPRTKELLVGHPALFLGLAALLAGRRNWAAPLLVVGTIGLVSVVNTFCHAHTPILLSVARVCVGAVLGLVIGVAVLWVSRWFVPRTAGGDGQSAG